MIARDMCALRTAARSAPAGRARRGLTKPARSRRPCMAGSNPAAAPSARGRSMPSHLFLRMRTALVLHMRAAPALAAAAGLLGAALWPGPAAAQVSGRQLLGWCQGALGQSVTAEFDAFQCS